MLFKFRSQVRHAKHEPVHQHHNHKATYRFSTYNIPSTIDMPCYEIEVNLNGHPVECAPLKLQGR